MARKLEAQFDGQYLMSSVLMTSTMKSEPGTPPIRDAVNSFGAGLILPFEIIYLHHARGFPTATAGLVLAAIMGTAAVVTPLSGALLDRFRAKPILIAGNLASALGYAGFAFVERPWQAFVCSVVGSAGFGVASTANQVLSLTLVSAEQRASSIALRRPRK